MVYSQSAVSVGVAGAGGWCIVRVQWMGEWQVQLDGV